MQTKTVYMACVAAFGVVFAQTHAAIVYQSHQLQLFGNALTMPPDTQGYDTSFNGPGVWNWTESVSVQHQYPASPGPATAFSKGVLRSSADAAFLHVFMEGSIENHPIGGTAGSDTFHNAYETFVLTVDTPFTARTWGGFSDLFIQRLDPGPPFGFGLTGDQSISDILPAGTYNIIARVLLGTFNDTPLMTAGFEYRIPAPATLLAFAFLVPKRRRRPVGKWDDLRLSPNP